MYKMINVSPELQGAIETFHKKGYNTTLKEGYIITVDKEEDGKKKALFISPEVIIKNLSGVNDVTQFIKYLYLPLSFKSSMKDKKITIQLTVSPSVEEAFEDYVSDGFEPKKEDAVLRGLQKLINRSFDSAIATIANKIVSWA